VDIGRDLIDHRLTDTDDQDAGMVDDLWITWHDTTARLGPLVTGTAALIGQLGRMATPLTHAARRIGWTHAQVWREIPWDRIDRVERPQVVLLIARAQLSTLPVRSQPTTPTNAILYTQLIKLPVRTKDGARLGIIDVRTGPQTAAAPTILGLLLAPHPHTYTLGMKRYDTTTTRLGGIPGGFYLAWADITTLTHTITTRLTKDELSPLANAPQPALPPMPTDAQKP
jgi:hypothetical protein